LKPPSTPLLSSLSLHDALPIYPLNRVHLPDTPYRTTSDMLEQFSFLDDDTAYEIVVENSNAIAEKVEPIAPLKNDLYTPSIEGAEEEIKQLTYGNAEKIY